MTSGAYRGIWPVAPTPFQPNGDLDLPGMRRVLDCMIDQGVDGICILANFSEQFLLSDAERETLAELCLAHIAGRVTVIVAVSHFATDIVAARARRAQSLGADIVMMMPPYHGAQLKGNAAQIFTQFARVGEVGIPIMLQDAPLSGVELPAPLLIDMARKIEMLKLFKIECPGAASKLRELSGGGGGAIEGLFDGEEAITLLADLDAGASGSMTSALIPDQIKPVIAAHARGDRPAAVEGYARILPVINHENRQCGFRAAKAVMAECGVIRSDFSRHPVEPLHPQTRAHLMALIRDLNPVLMNWGK